MNNDMNVMGTTIICIVCIGIYSYALFVILSLDENKLNTIYTFFLHIEFFKIQEKLLNNSQIYVNIFNN